MLKVSYFACTQDPPHGQNIGRLIHETVAEVQVAEKSGFDSCLFSEHHQQADGYIPNPLLLAGLVGMKTEKIRVGTCVSLLPLQHPVHIAEDCAIIDQATGGRMILSVGVGYQKVDFDLFGASIEERARRTEEGIDIIKKAWTEERFSFQGKHFQLQDVSITPKPAQRPRPPIWMAAWTDVGLRRTARMADGWLTDPLQSLSVIKRFTDLYRAECEKRRVKPFIALMRDVWVADSMEKAKQESGPLMYTHRFYFRNKAYVEDECLKGITSEEQWTFERAQKDRFISGSPEHCREQLQMWQKEIRADYLILRMRHPGGPDHKRVVEAIRMFGDKVLPHL
jgi:alkanesulfonate monooxygenase SsuD/methylene tetrahydromethanopterin reductase-like flavin-dependent oxidoreductase (luciferase family)